MKEPKYPRASCQHFTATGRRSTRRACYTPGLPQLLQGLCASCLGEAMSKHATEAYAVKLSRKIAGQVADLDFERGWPGSQAIEEICKPWLLEMAAFAKRRKARERAFKCSPDISLAG